MISITHPYWPMTTPQEYYAYSIYGKFNPTTHMLDLINDPDDPQKQTKRAPASDHRRTYKPLGAGFPATAIVYSPRGAPPPTNWQDACYGLTQAVGAASGGDGYIGEAGEFTDWPAGSRTCHFGLQPEPQLPLDVTQYRDPIDGLTIGNRWNKDTGAVEALSVAWRFRNLGPGPNGVWFWPHYPDQIRTCLIERPDTFKDEWIYNYVFAKGVGPICIWWGLRDRDNTVRGWMFQLVG